jgi:histone arginine demethylase JMJD6
MDALQATEDLAVRYPEIDRRAGLSRDEFRREYLYPGKPVVITDAIDNWKARSAWTLDYFRTRYGATEVTVYRLDGERYQPNAKETLSLSVFIDKVKNFDFDKYPYYVRDDWRLFTIHNELLTDYEVPSYFFDWFKLLPPMMRLVYPRIFIGPRGAITPLHLDIWATHAWLAQLVGRKRWILFSPEQRELLYEYRVQPHKPDLKRFPLFAKTRPVECTIGPGDLIFVPSGWAHEVTSLDATISITHNYMGPGCFRSSVAGSMKTQVLGRIANRLSS